MIMKQSILSYLIYQMQTDKNQKSSQKSNVFMFFPNCTLKSFKPKSPHLTLWVLTLVIMSLLSFSRAQWETDGFN